MPYIEPEKRPEINRHVDNLAPASPGELAYTIMRLIKNYEKDHGTRFFVLNDIMGVLVNLSLEYYQTVVGPYESQKLLDNGGIYDEPEQIRGRTGPNFSPFTKSFPGSGSGSIRDDSEGGTR